MSDILKEILVKCEISYPLSALINKSIESGYVPKSMKIAKVVPIYTVTSLYTRDHDLVSNDRPISILPSISNVLERIIYERTYKYLYGNHILYNSQYEFRPKHSTPHVAVDFIKQIIDAIESKNAS